MFKEKLCSYFDDDEVSDPKAKEWPNKVAGALNRRFIRKSYINSLSKMILQNGFFSGSIALAMRPSAALNQSSAPRQMASLKFYTICQPTSSRMSTSNTIFRSFQRNPSWLRHSRRGTTVGRSRFFSIFHAEQIERFPGASAGKTVLKQHVEPYKSAIIDFFKMVPQACRSANAVEFPEVEKFLKDPTGTRPTLNAAPSSAESAGFLFDVL